MFVLKVSENIYNSLCTSLRTFPQACYINMSRIEITLIILRILSSLVIYKMGKITGNTQDSLVRNFWSFMATSQIPNIKMFCQFLYPNGILKLSSFLCTTSHLSLQYPLCEFYKCPNWFAGPILASFDSPSIQPPKWMLPSHPAVKSSTTFSASVLLRFLNVISHQSLFLYSGIPGKHLHVSLTNPVICDLHVLFTLNSASH